MKIWGKFFTISGFTVLSRVLGAARETFLTHYLGDGIEMDAFLAAFKFPCFFRRVFSEGSFQSIFVPYISDFFNSNKKRGAQYFISRSFSLIFWIMLLFTIIVICFAKEFVLLMAPGFINNPEKLNLTISFTRIIFPSMLFISTASVFTSLLIAKQKFLAFSLPPIITNIVLILFICFYPWSINTGFNISYGILTASIIQFIFLYFSLYNSGIQTINIFKIRPSRKIIDMGKKLLPVMAGASFMQINIFISTFFCSFFPTGSLTHFHIADRILQLPLALFGISMSTILLSEITKIKNKKLHSFQEPTINILIIAMRLTFPVMIILITLSYFIISIMFNHGEFYDSAAQKTANILILLSFSLPALVSSKIISSFYFAQKNTKTPMIASIYAIITNIVLSFLLLPMKEKGLAIAISISGFVNMFFLLRNNNFCSYFDRKSLLSLLKIILASIVMLCAIILIKIFFTSTQDNILSNLFFLFCTIGFGIAIYIFVLFVLKDYAIRNMCHKMKNKFL